ncbi:potassium channel subfamily K [Metschnikowia aff. pulcherrima]|uniref:Potassium channel subfamily K n=1 Tax=Metschnikowia aff. pulcherrima TaxID=2163413 RepID=A0A4P6XRM8_9ASCO|nr:potassium channel subfamily K [Metschnikowia aff. pulcherrima]
MGTGIRRRITSARDMLTPLEHYLSLQLARETMLKYREKLQPIFPAEFFEKLENNEQSESSKNTENRSTSADHRKLHFILQHSLAVPMVTVANLHVQPGDRYFSIWLFISAYFPVIAACVAPLGNLISFVCLLEHWQMDPVTLKTVPDYRPAFALNIASFVLGIVGNISLLMNFSGRMHYLLAQGVSITCFVLAQIFLLTAVLVTSHRIRRSPLDASEGFWLAVFTIGIYAMCSSVLIINVIGYKFNKYRARFNLDKKQRLLMSHTISFSIWQAVGTVCMANLIPGIAYGTSLYYCTVLMLTIGLGDIVPLTPGAKVFALFFSLVGVLIMGLIISVLRQVILYSAGPSLFWHHLERKRMALIEKLEKDDKNSSSPETFAMMRTLRSKVTRTQEHRALALTVFVFILFWLLGALIFHSIEGWSYFNAMYFCFLCLLTIGYGDFYPQKPLGHVFFVVWAIAAVPLMTILISNLGDTLFDLSDKLDRVAVKLFQAKTYKRLLMGKKYSAAIKKEHDHSKAVHEAVEDKNAYPHTTQNSEDADTSLNTSDIDQKSVEQMHLALGIADSMTLLKQILADSMDIPGKEYDFEEWAKHMRHLENPNAEGSGFWISDLSPLRLPLKESNYLLLKLLLKIDRDLLKLLKAQSQAFMGDHETIEDHASSLKESSSKES